MIYRHPLLRLVVLTIFVLTATAVASQAMRWFGAQQQYAPALHPFMDGHPWRVARLDPAHCDEAGIDNLMSLKDWVLWIDVQPSGADEFKIVCPAEPLELGPSATGPPLQAVVERLAAKHVIFNVRAIDASAADKFLNSLAGFSDKKSDVGIASPSQSFLRTLRKRRPDWLYAADSSTWAKLKMFSTMGIETAADLWPDFFVASFDSSAPNFFSLAGAKEILRRKKVVLLEWDGVTPIPEPWKENLQGILTYRPKKVSVDTFFSEKGAH